MNTEKEELWMLFQKSPPSRKNFILWLIGLIVILLLALLISLGEFSTTHYDFEWDKDGKREFIIFALAFAIGLIGNLLASVIYEILHVTYLEKQEQNKIQIIENLADKRLIVEILDELKYYNKRFCEDYVVNAKLKQHPTSQKFFVCEVRFHYKKILTSKDLIFQFVRIINEDDTTRVEKDESQLADNYLKNEFYHIFDEREFPKHDINDLIYKLNYLEVLIDGERTSRLPITSIVENNTFRYESSLPSDVQVGNKLVTIDYEVEFMIEKESHSSFSIDLPTKNIRFEFDFSEVCTEIDLYAYDFLSSHRGPIPLHSLNETKIRLVKEDWILPKSSFLFIWYKKQ